MNNEPPSAGYKKPPAEHQFRKGQSGNPGGRPKKSTAKRDILACVFGEKQRLNGQSRGARVWYSWLELLVMALKKRAVSGHVPASKLLDEMSDKFSEQERQNEPRYGLLVIPERLTMEEWVAKYSPKDDPPDDVEQVE